MPPASAKEMSSSPDREVSVSELAAHDGRDSSAGVWTAINGVVHDITEWRSTHPGGAIIRLAAGREASCLVDSYHPASCSAKVVAALRTQCPIVGKLTGTEPAGNDAFFRAVRSRVDAHLKSNGYGRTTELITLAEFAVTVVVYLVSSYYVATAGSIPWAIVLGIFTGRLGFIMHSGNHRAMSHSGVINNLGSLVMDFVGAAQLPWQFEHQVAHHMHPNQFGKDNDCEIANPYLRFHPEIKQRWWHRYNHVVTMLGMSTGLFKWFLADPFVLAAGSVGNVSFHVTKSDWALLISTKAIWYAMHIVAPLYYTGVARTLTCLTIFMVIGAYYIESIFIVNHIQSDLVPPTNAHWANVQVMATANWASASKFWNFFSGGLNHQIEHHLFPTYSIFLYPVMSPIVKQTCEEFGLPYHNFPNFPSAWWAMICYLRDLGSPKSKFAAAAAAAHVHGH